MAQSACTAMWGSVDVGGTKTLRFYSPSTNRWITAGFAALTGNANALAGDPTTGYLYYVNRTNSTLRRIDLNARTDTSLGTIPAAPAPASVANAVGATVDSGGHLWIYATDGGNPAFAVVAQVNTSSPPTTATSWMRLRTAAGGTPTIAGSGDIYTDNANASYVLTNTNPPRRWRIELTPNVTRAQVTVTDEVQITGVGANNIAGVAVNPADQLTYFGTTDSGEPTWRFNDPGGASSTTASLLDTTTTYTVADMGNCVSPPAPPTVSKTFTPGYAPRTPGTATLTIDIGNPNSVPLWLGDVFRDVLPAGMVVANTPALTSTCSSPSGTPTTAARSNSVTFAIGGRIPAGGCSITLRVSATAAVTPYTNTIPAGSVTTSAGSNAAAASDTFQVGTNFSLSKAQRDDTDAAPQETPLTIGAQLTVQYILTVVNSASGGTGSVSFTDTLPSRITPVLSVTPLMAGGGGCNAATAVVAGRTRVSGTVTNALAGATCTVTITARGSTTVGTFQNTATLAALAGTTDTDASDNAATVTTTINPAALLTITKTNSLSAVTAGQTVGYTITVANLGPSAAPGSVVSDYPSEGLECVSLTCTPTGSVSCPSPLSVAALQSTGLKITPTFNANSTLTFRLTCNVTATGQ